MAGCIIFPIKILDWFAWQSQEQALRDKRPVCAECHPPFSPALHRGADALPGTFSQPFMAGTGPILQMRKLGLTEAKKPAKFTQPKSVEQGWNLWNPVEEGQGLPEHYREMESPSYCSGERRKRERRGSESPLWAEGLTVGRASQDGK